MIKNITYRNKFLYLAFAGIFALILVYSISIKETLKVRSEYLFAKERTQNVAQANSSILFYERELSKIDSIVGSDSYVGNYAQEQLLNVISNYCSNNGLSVVNFPTPHVYSDEDYKVLTYNAIVSGGFIKLIGLLYKLEQGSYPGVIKSVYFYIEKRSYSAQTQLLMSLYIQDIKDNRDEKD